MALIFPMLVAFTMSACISSILKRPLPHPAFNSAADIDPSYFPVPGFHTGVTTTNNRLQDAVKAFKGRINGTESVSVGKDGALYLPDKYGVIHRAALSGTESVPLLDSEPWAFLGGGRPLGADFDTHGNFIVCLPPVGLVMVEASSRRVTILTSKVDGQNPQYNRTARISYPNDLVIDETTGDIYFSDSSEIPPVPEADGAYGTMAAFMMTAFQGSPSGRVLKYSPSKGTTTVVADHLWYPNGVALSKDRTFLVVAETCSLRLRRIKLVGTQAGTVTTLTDGLTGYPDGVSTAPDGSFWVALISPSQDAITKYLLPYKALRALAAKYYMAMRPTPPGSGQVLKVSQSGEPQLYLQDPTSSVVSGISSVVQHGRRLYFGHLSGDYISYLDIKQ